MSNARVKELVDAMQGAVEMWKIMTLVKAKDGPELQWLERNEWVRRRANSRTVFVTDIGHANYDAIMNGTTGEVR